MRRARIGFGIAAAALLSTTGFGTQRVGAASSLEIRGTVVCASNEPVVGVWVQSSGGGSNFAGWTAYPGKPHVARYSLKMTTNLTTSIYLNVGCGRTPAQWGRSARTVTLKVTSGVQAFLNARCPAGKTTCTSPVMENNTPAAPSTNVFEASQCTARGADFWKRMTGRFPNWRNPTTGRYGNAGEWDDNAGATGWQVEGVPMPDSLAIWQPSGSGVGHVGYVANVRVRSGVLEMFIYDRNWSGPGVNRNGVWVAATSSMRFIVVPPRADSIAR